MNYSCRIRRRLLQKAPVPSPRLGVEAPSCGSMGCWHRYPPRETSLPAGRCSRLQSSQCPHGPSPIFSGQVGTFTGTRAREPPSFVGTHDPRQRIAIQSQWTNPHAREVGRAGPVPILRPWAQTAANRIAVKVFDQPVDGGRLHDVAVIPAAPLPEPVVDLAGRLAICHPTEEGRRLPPNERHRPLRDRLFYGVEDLADVVDRLRRPDEQVDVFGHDGHRPTRRSDAFRGLYRWRP